MGGGNKSFNSNVVFLFFHLLIVLTKRDAANLSV
jgi:hypothetical protein